MNNFVTTSSRRLQALIFIHLLITGAGLLLHLKSHDLGQSLFFWWAAPVSLFNLIVVSLLYLNSRTVAWGVLFNGMTVGIGVVGMAYFSVKTIEAPFTPAKIVLHSTVPYILLLLAKLPLASLIMKEVGRSAYAEEQ